MKRLPSWLSVLATTIVMTACSGPILVTVTPVVTAAQATGTPHGVAMPTAVEADETPGGIITLVYWEQESADIDAFLDSLAGAFMSANPTIKIARVHFGTEELLARLRSAALTGEVPALTRGPNENVGPLTDMGAIQPVDGLFATGFFGQFIPASLEPVQLNGQRWGVPDNYGGHLVLLYNKKLLTEPVPADTDAWLVQLKSLTDPSKPQYGLAYNLNEPFWLTPWIAGFGGWQLDAQGQPDLNSPAVLAALQFVSDLKFQAKVVPSQASYDAADVMFKQGQAVYLINGDWSLDDYRDAGVDFGVASLPRVTRTGQYPMPMTTGKYWYFTQGIKGARLDAARKFVAYMTSKEVQAQWVEKWRRLPSNIEASKSDAIAADPILQGSMAALSRGRGMSPAPQLTCTWEAMRPGLEAVMAGSATPAAAAQKMQDNALQCVADLGSPKATAAP